MCGGGGPTNIFLSVGKKEKKKEGKGKGKKERRQRRKKGKETKKGEEGERKRKKERERGRRREREANFHAVARGGWGVTHNSAISADVGTPRPAGKLMWRRDNGRRLWPSPSSTWRKKEKHRRFGGAVTTRQENITTNFP